MPYVDGIQLARIINKEHPKTKVAFISGYDEFAYAKEAIELNVVSYLSKPITEEEVSHFLSKLKARLDEEYQALFNQERLDEVYKENLPALIENQFNSLLHFSSIDDQDLQRFKIFNIDLSVGYFTVGIIEIDAAADFLEIEYLRIFFLNLLKKKFDDYKNLYYINSGFGLVFIIHQLTLDVKDLETRLYEVVLT
jgi:two-component system response regulator YesN